MSIFSSIMSKIFGHNTASAAPVSDSATPATPGSPAAPSPSAAPATPGAAPAAPMQDVDVQAVLTDMATKNGQSLNWKSSIVDLMKLLGLDSSLEARKELAKELSYSGDTGDSASMNIWLHKQVMQKLAANGGKVPAELKD